jgi:hypothetical protein
MARTHERRALFVEAFPDWKQFPPTCHVREGIEQRASDRWNSAIRSLTADARDVLVRRLQGEHHPPVKNDDRADQAVRGVMTEAMAFGWAREVAHLPNPRLVSNQQGTPDIACDGPVWIEAKGISQSDGDAAADEAARREAQACSTIPARVATATWDASGLVRKFESAFSNALSKFERVGAAPASSVLFFHLLQEDLAPVRDAAFSSLAAWANARDRDTGVRVVVAYNFMWEEPWIDTSPLAH